MIVLEQLIHNVERLAAADGKEIAPDRGFLQQRFAFGLRQRLGIALGEQDVPGDFFGTAIPFAEGLGVFFGEPRHVGDGLFAIASEHQRGAVAVGLAEFVARRDVGDPVFEAEILEPGRLRNMEMINGMQIVVEARDRCLLGAQPAAVFQPPVHQEHIEAGFRQVAAKDQAMMAGADNDAVVGLVQGLGHAVLLHIFVMHRTANLRC